jgi:hypothetical protein
MSITNKTIAQFMTEKKGADGTYNPEELLEMLASVATPIEKPKKSLSAYLLFAGSVREKLKAELKEEDPEMTKFIGPIAKKTSELWKAASPEEKAPFDEEAAKLKEIYVTAKRDYDSKVPKAAKAAKAAKAGGSKKQTATFVPGDSPEAPPGMTGPLDGYLAQTPIDPETKKRKAITFTTFQEAVSKCFALGDACGGITRTKRGYTLRAGGKVVGIIHDKNEVSWTKNSGASQPMTGHTVISAPVVAPLLDPSPCPGDSGDNHDSDDDSDESSTDNLKDEVDEEVVVAEAVVAVDEEIVVAEAVDEVDEDEVDEDEVDEDEDDEDEAEEEYPEWIFEGKTYYIDEETNEVMNEDGEVIGKKGTKMGKKGGKIQKVEYIIPC